MADDADNRGKNVHLEFSYFYEDFYPGGWRWTFAPAYFMRWVGPWAVVLGGGSFAYWDFKRSGGQLDAAGWISLAVTPGAFLAMVRINLFYRNWQHRRWWHRKNAGKVFTLVLSPEGLQWQEGTRTVEEKWVTYQNFRETPSEFILAHVNAHKPTILLPKRVIPVAQLTLLQELLSSHLPRAGDDGAGISAQPSAQQ